MLLTRRALVLLLLVALPVGAASFWPPTLAFAALYLVAVVALLFADLAVSPARSDFAVSRRCDSRLSLAADNPIHLHLYNASPFPVRIALRDEFPTGFQSDRWQVGGIVAAQQELVLTYHLRPLRRGDYQFGDVNLRFHSRLGLLLRQERYAAAAPVKVYPNLRELRRYELLARRGQLAEVGLRNVRIFGRGTEFERLRDYQADDDYRRINWKATARRGRPVSTEYETERSQNIVLLLDAGRLMAAPSGPLAKLDYAINTALMLAYVATQMGDNVGLLAFADRISAYLPPRRGKRQFLAMIEALYRLPAQWSETDFNLAFRYFAAHMRKRALVVLFTDIVDATAARLLVGHIAALSPHHLALCVTLADPGIMRLAAAEPNDSLSVYRRAVAEQLLGERRLALQELRRRGAISLDLAADRLTAGVVNRYLELKARTRI